jgi:hypothetical protein
MLLSRVRPNLTNKFSYLYRRGNFIDFRYNLYISHVSPDDGPSEPKHAVSGITETFLCDENLNFYEWNGLRI